MKMSKVTVYIPCHNAEKFIARCLTALLEQSLRPAEIIVINDACTDRTVQIAGEFPVRIVHLPSHNGLAAGRNAAIEEAGHEYVASIDADCIVEQTWLENLMKNILEEDVGGVGGKLIEAHQEKLADRWRAVHMRQNWGNGKIINPPFLFGCNTLFRKSALEEIGGYDKRFRTNGEDVDISLRLKAKGYKIIYEPSAIVKHLKRDTVLSVLKSDWNWGRWGLSASGDTLKFESNSNIVYFNFTSAKYQFLKDAADMRYSLIPIDVMLFFHHAYGDFYHARRLGLPKFQGIGISSRIRTLVDFQAHLDSLSEKLMMRNPPAVSTGRSHTHTEPASPARIQQDQGLKRE